MSRTPEKPAALAQAGAEVVKGNLTNASDLQAALRGVHGVFAMSTPMRADKKLAMVALRDIGEFGAPAFMRPNDFLGQAIDLAGDELTMQEVAAQLPKFTRRSIQF
jgi:uncharacterized protein YbjT (DUF2867 family)